MSTVPFDPTGVGANAGAMRMYYNPTTRGVCCADRCLAEVLTGGTASATTSLTLLSGSGPYTLPATGVSGLRKTLVNGSMVFSPFPGKATGGLTGATVNYSLAATGTLLYAAGDSSIYQFDTVSNSFVPGWRTDCNGQIMALGCMGNRLWAGGSFTGVSYSGVTTPCTNIACYDAASGAWFAPATGPNGAVRAVAASASGSMLYLGGSFTAVGSLAASRVVALNTANNIYTNPNPFGSGVDNDVNALALSGPNLHIGGNFYTAGGSPSERLASFDTSTNTWTRYANIDGYFDGQVLAIAVAGPSLFVGGQFTLVQNGTNDYPTTNLVQLLGNGVLTTYG